VLHYGHLSFRLSRRGAHVAGDWVLSGGRQGPSR